MSLFDRTKSKTIDTVDREQLVHDYHKALNYAYNTTTSDALENLKKAKEQLNAHKIDKKDLSRINDIFIRKYTEAVAKSVKYSGRESNNNTVRNIQKVLAAADITNEDIAKSAKTNSTVQQNLQEAAEKAIETNNGNKVRSASPVRQNLTKWGLAEVVKESLSDAAKKTEFDNFMKETPASTGKQQVKLVTTAPFNVPRVLAVDENIQPDGSNRYWAKNKHGEGVEINDPNNAETLREVKGSNKKTYYIDSKGNVYDGETFAKKEGWTYDSNKNTFNKAQGASFTKEQSTEFNEAQKAVKGVKPKADADVVTDEFVAGNKQAREQAYQDIVKDLKSLSSAKNIPTGTANDLGDRIQNMSSEELQRLKSEESELFERVTKDKNIGKNVEKTLGTRAAQNDSAAKTLVDEVYTEKTTLGKVLDKLTPEGKDFVEKSKGLAAKAQDGLKRARGLASKAGDVVKAQTRGYGNLAAVPLSLMTTELTRDLASHVLPGTGMSQEAADTIGNTAGTALGGGLQWASLANMGKDVAPEGVTPADAAKYKNWRRLVPTPANVAKYGALAVLGGMAENATDDFLNRYETFQDKNTGTPYPEYNEYRPAISSLAGYTVPGAVGSLFGATGMLKTSVPAAAAAAITAYGDAHTANKVNKFLSGNNHTVHLYDRTNGEYVGSVTLGATDANKQQTITVKAASGKPGDEEKIRELYLQDMTGKGNDRHNANFVAVNEGTLRSSYLAQRRLNYEDLIPIYEAGQKIKGTNQVVQWTPSLAFWNSVSKGINYITRGGKAAWDIGREWIFDDTNDAWEKDGTDFIQNYGKQSNANVQKLRLTGINAQKAKIANVIKNGDIATAMANYRIFKNAGVNEKHEIYGQEMKNLTDFLKSNDIDLTKLTEAKRETIIDEAKQQEKRNQIVNQMIMNGIHRVPADMGLTPTQFLTKEGAIKRQDLEKQLQGQGFAAVVNGFNAAAQEAEQQQQEAKAKVQKVNETLNTPVVSHQ